MNQKGKIPAADVYADLSLARYASVSGKRLFIVPNLMNRWTRIPEKLESRKTNVVLRNSFTDIDTIAFRLPEGIYPEYVPAPIVLKSKFGEYEAKFEMDEEKLVYTRKLRMNKGKFPPAAYQELSDFMKNINKADNTKMVFLNKT